MIHDEHPQVLALDIGTSGVRASLFDETGREIEGATVRTDRHFSSSSTLPEEIVGAVALTIDQLLTIASEADVETIAISCFWHSLLGINANEQPTTAVLGWADTRATAEARDLRARLNEQETHARVGCRFHPSYWPAKLLWLRNAEREITEQTTRWLSVSDFVTLRLFGNQQTSVSMASGTGLMNQRACTWDETLLDVLCIPPESLPKISADGISDLKLTTEHAKRWPQLARARLFPPLADGAANNIGAGCASLNKLALMVGTSAAARILFEGNSTAGVPMELWSYRADRKRVVVGGALSDGGGLYQRLRNELLPNANAATVADALIDMEPDSHGLTVLPFWAGERSPGWSLNARGGIFGITQSTKPIEILRAAMEAVAYRLALIVRELDGICPDASIVAAGNALQSSPVWLQIIADVLGRTVTLTTAREASSRGAALLALEATGKIPSLETVDESISDTTIAPDSFRHSIYQKAIERQVKLYNATILPD